MLDEEMRLSLPTEEDLPCSDEKPVDNELQLLAPMLLRGVLHYIWGERFDWLFAINLGIYPDPYEKAIGPDAFLSIGVERVRADSKLRLSYLVYQEKVMPQWVLEIVSKKPGGEYGEKFRRYREMGVLYYVIYNPTHYRRDKHETFEVYRLENGQYVLQQGNPVWMPEIGLGIGHERGLQDGHLRDWLYWYDENGKRYPPQEETLRQMRLLREIELHREYLIRQSLEEQLTQEKTDRAVLEQSCIQAKEGRNQEQQIRSQQLRSIVLRSLTRDFGALPSQISDRISNLPIADLESLGEALFDFESIENLTQWLNRLK
jgi:Uma2 family endonuclease